MGGTVIPLAFLRRANRQVHVLDFVALCAVFAFPSAVLHAQNPNMGTLELKAAAKRDKTAGVWIDGVYVGYVDELKDDKAVTLLPGPHELAVRKSGYEDFTRTVVIQPRRIEKVTVALSKVPGAHVPAQTVTLKLSVNPNRAAVFLDGHYVGHAAEFGGLGRAMEVSPGRHRIRVELPGYQPFETEVNLVLGQKAQVSTDLVKGSVEQSGPNVMPSSD
jgi:hypothetical protein